MFVLLPIGWIVMGLLGGRILAHKGYDPKYGIVLGLLGVIGLFVALLLPLTDSGKELEQLEYDIIHGPKRANCPDCGKQIKYGSAVCPHCQYVI